MLDAYDVRLLSALQRDASISNVALAELVHLSASQCARRFDRLRQEGYIERIVAQLDPAKLGLHVMAHSLVSLQSHDIATNRGLRDFIAGSPEVLECYAQTGDADLIMKIVVGSLAHLSDFFDRLLAVTGGLAALRSGVVLKVLKESRELPITPSGREA